MNAMHDRKNIQKFGKTSRWLVAVARQYRYSIIIDQNFHPLPLHAWHQNKSLSSVWFKLTCRPILFIIYSRLLTSPHQILVYFVEKIITLVCGTVFYCNNLLAAERMCFLVLFCVLICREFHYVCSCRPRDIRYTTYRYLCIFFYLFRFEKRIIIRFVLRNSSLVRLLRLVCYLIIML